MTDQTDKASADVSIDERIPGTRDRQISAALLLVALLDLGLPVATWLLSATSDGKLSGQINRGIPSVDPEEERNRLARAALDRWADHFQTMVTVAQTLADGSQVLAIYAELDGVPFEVWTMRGPEPAEPEAIGGLA